MTVKCTIDIINILKSTNAFFDFFEKYKCIIFNCKIHNLIRK